MNNGELHQAFKILLDKSDIVGYPSFLPEEIDFWYNMYIREFVKTRAYGHTSYRDGFQQNEKRDNDLRMAVQTYTQSYILNETSIDVTRPDDFWFAIGEDVSISSYTTGWPTIPFSSITNTSTGSTTLTAISPTYDIVPLSAYYINVTNNVVNGELTYGTLVTEKISVISVSSTSLFPVTIDGVLYDAGDVLLFHFDPAVSATASITVLTGIPYEKEVDTLECTYENITSRKNNPLSEHRLNRNNAKPIRISERDYIHLETDGNYFFTQYVLNYISVPDLVDYRMPSREYTYIPEHAHDELVSGAVHLALESVSDPRFNTRFQLGRMME